VASSALAQAISGAQESSAVAQVASSAFERRSVSSADAQVASSALAQAISGAQASSAVAQVASSAVAQAVSGARESSAVAQVASSALAQAISGAQESSAVAQVASSAFERRSVSSADAQVASSALAQAISGAQASSADAQYTSSARASSAVAQVASQAVASSAQAEAALSGLLEQKDTIKADLNASKNPILEMINTVYSTSGGATTESVTQLQSMIAALMDKQNQLKTTATNIFRFRDYYQDTALQTVVPEPNLRVSGAKKVYDSLRNRYIVVDSNGTIIPNPATPATRSYTTFTMRGGDSVPA
jgi:exonuclease V gamma subunit